MENEKLSNNGCLRQLGLGRVMFLTRGDGESWWNTGRLSDLLGTSIKSKSWTSGKTIIFRKWGTFTQLCFRDVMEKWADQVFKEVGLPVCVCFGETNVHQHTL